MWLVHPLQNIQGVSVNQAILQHCFFWFGNTGADAAIAILLTTFKHFSCNEPWTGAQCAFAVKAFYKNSDSFVTAQRKFQREFGIHRNCAIPSAHAIKTWVQNFKTTGSTLKKKGGIVKTVHKPENIAVVREVIEGSPHRSARSHSVSLRLSEASVRRTGFTLPPFFFSVEPVTSKFRTHVLMAWADGTAQLRWIPNSLRNSRWAITKLSPFLQNAFTAKHTVLQSTAPLQLKRFKFGSKMVIAASAPVLPDQKKQCCKIAQFTDAPCILL